MSNVADDDFGTFNYTDSCPVCKATRETTRVDVAACFGMVLLDVVPHATLLEAICDYHAVMISHYYILLGDLAKEEFSQEDKKGTIGYSIAKEIEAMEKSPDIITAVESRYSTKNADKKLN